MSHFSINRYLAQPWIFFMPDEVLDLLQTLEKKRHFFSPNPLQLYMEKILLLLVMVLRDTHMLKNLRDTNYNVTVGVRSEKFLTKCKKMGFKRILPRMQ